MSLSDLLPTLWAHIQLVFPGAIIQEVPPDGDCFFHAIVDQLLRRYGVRTAGFENSGRRKKKCFATPNFAPETSGGELPPRFHPILFG